MSDTIVHFKKKKKKKKTEKKTEKKFLVNNFCMPELYTLKFLIQKETMVMQTSAASPSPNFNSGKSYVKNITVYFRD